jgi:2TM domain
MMHNQSGFETGVRIEAMSDEQLYSEIRARAEKRAKKRGEFYQHLAIYIIVNLFLWLIFLVLGAFLSSPIPLIIPFLSTLGWGLAVAIHATVTYIETGAMEAMREREIEREMQREMHRRGIADESELYEKPKRDQVVRLSDDGELVYEEDEPAKKSSGRRAK